MLTVPSTMSYIPNNISKCGHPALTTITRGNNSSHQPIKNEISDRSLSTTCAMVYKLDFINNISFLGSNATFWHEINSIPTNLANYPDSLLESERRLLSSYQESSSYVHLSLGNLLRHIGTHFGFKSRTVWETLNASEHLDRQGHCQSYNCWLGFGLGTGLPK